MCLINQFKNLKTTNEKRLFALKYVVNNKAIELLSYEKISEFTISAMFYESQNKKYIIKRNYKANYMDDKEY